MMCEAFDASCLGRWCNQREKIGIVAHYFIVRRVFSILVVEGVRAEFAVARL